MSSFARRVRAAAWTLLVLALAGGCAQPPTRTAEPTPQWLHVQISPALNLPQELVSSCTPAGVGLAVQSISGAAFSDELLDLRLRLGPAHAETGYAAQIGHDDLVVVVNPSNPLTSLTFSALQITYLGQLPAWDWDYLGQAPAVLTAYAYVPSSDLGGLIAALLLPAGQSLAPEIVQAPGPSEVRASIAADPGGLGILPRQWVDDRLRVVELSGTDPAAWRVPILALSTAEPQGVARQWLLCIQQGLP